MDIIENENASSSKVDNNLDNNKETKIKGNKGKSKDNKKDTDSKPPSSGTTTTTSSSSIKACGNDETSSINAVWKIWDYSEAFDIPETSWKLKGYSIAALRTNFIIKELGIMFDAGLSLSNMAFNYIFITHAHSDHTANIPFHIYSAKINEGLNMQIYTPEESKDKIKNFIEAAYVMSSDVDDSIKRDELYLYNYFSMIGVVPKQIIPLNIKNKKFLVEIIKCYHSVPCVGYGLIEQRQKLKEEFKNLPGKEIGELRKKGVELNYTQDYPLFCYLGDTNKEVLKEEAIWKYRTIMIECTFILDDEIQQAEKTFHIHWKDIESHIIKNPDKTFILYHFSQRYTTKELKDFFDKTGLKNVYPWISG